MKTALVALGGNTLVKPGDEGTADQQFERMSKTCEKIAKMVDRGYSLVLTHGNGPQVGNILLQNEMASGSVPSMPLDICGARSQGQIGYMFQQTLKNELQEVDIERDISTVITQVQVDEEDPAFDEPSKFIGPTYSEEEAEKMKKEKGWSIKETSRGIYRRVVPSPEPISIIESEVIKELIYSGKDNIVISAGGGGVPVIKKGNGLKGVEGVIDKDKASAALAKNIDEDFFVMLTNVEQVYLNFGEEDERPIQSMSFEEAKKYLNGGQFPPGSMGPKIEASIDFLKNGGDEVLITNPGNLLKGLDGKAGTRIY